MSRSGFWSVCRLCFGLVECNAQWANMGGQGTIGCNFDFLNFFGFITSCYVFYEPDISLYIVFGPFTGI